jgi:hypothetical protein
MVVGRGGVLFGQTGMAGLSPVVAIFRFTDFLGRYIMVKFQFGRASAVLVVFCPVETQLI